MAVTDRLLGTDLALAVKAACTVATTANITLSSTQVIDGIAVGSGERILVKDQTGSTENGIYVSGANAWQRAADADGTRDIIPGTLVYVDRGNTNNQSFWVFNSSSTSISVEASDDKILSQVTVSLSGVSGEGQKFIQNTSAINMRSTLGFATTSLDNALIRADSSDGLYQDSTWTLGDNSTMTAGGPFISSDIIMGSTLAMADNVIERPVIKDYAETLNAIGGSSATAIDIDLESGNIVSLALISTTARNFTFSNPPASGKAGSFTLYLTSSSTQDTISWPSAVDWPNGTAPKLTSSGVDVLTFQTLDGGAIWYGFVSARDMK